MAWLNVALDRRFINEAIAEERKHNDKRHNPGSYDSEDSPNPLENHPDNPEPPSLLELIKQCLREDIEGLFQQKQMPKYSHVNFRDVALRYLEDESLTEIADQCQVKYSSLNSFYHRSLEKFAPLIRKCCESHSS